MKCIAYIDLPSTYVMTVWYPRRAIEHKGPRIDFSNIAPVSSSVRPFFCDGSHNVTTVSDNHILGTGFHLRLSLLVILNLFFLFLIALTMLYIPY